MRTLYIVPIVHSRQDLGSLGPQIIAFKEQVFDRSTLSDSQSVVDFFWKTIRQTIVTWQVDFRQLLIYQDALPNTGHPKSEIEHRIVNDLAAQGNANHLLVKWLIDQGAKLVGTESIDLLLQEYNAAKRSLADGFRSTERDDKSKQEETANLLSLRDTYIANRISQTLLENQSGILFIGMLHRVEIYLPADIGIKYPFGQPNATTARIHHAGT